MSEHDQESDMVERITRALAANQKIEAIKIYREVRGSDLREAKDFIEELIPQLIEKDPERYSDLKQGQAGCGSTAAALLILAAVVAQIIS